MCETQRWQIAVFLGELAQRGNHRRLSYGDRLQRFADQDEVGVIGDVAACRPQMNDWPRRGTLVAVCMNMRHYIVPKFSFVLLGGVEVDVVGVCPQFSDLLFR